MTIRELISKIKSDYISITILKDGVYYKINSKDYECDCLDDEIKEMYAYGIGRCFDSYRYDIIV